MSRAAIEDLVHRYADAVVCYDGEQWGATWASDAEWTLAPGRELHGREAIIEFWHQAMQGFDAVIQTCLNGSCDLDASTGTGTGRWHIQESFRRKDGTTGILLAHYDDKYVLEAGQWKFADRKLVRHYHGPPDLSADFLTPIGPR